MNFQVLRSAGDDSPKWTKKVSRNRDKGHAQALLQRRKEIDLESRITRGRISDKPYGGTTNDGINKRARVRGHSGCKKSWIETRSLAEM